MIALRQLTKRFGDRHAVDELTLDVPRGEIFGLLGHNGAGKSTTIGMLLGQVWPTAGEALVCGHEVTRNRAQALAKVGAIFETPVFYDYLSGWRNLEILAGYTAPTPPARIREVVAWVGLTGREQSPVRTYSHGMRARLALAQALLPGPELLILDEPTNGLDPEGIHEMRGTIRRLHAELGLTILLSSHLLSEVEQLCSRIAVLNQGRKVFDGTLTEARRAQSWVRLVTGDFNAATNALRAVGLILGERDGEFIALAEGVSIADVVKRLVALGFPVHEIAPEKQTLEGFYLSLMKEALPAPPVPARAVQR
jgi:ABC-2 type transport system ATP-binding protein